MVVVVDPISRSCFRFIGMSMGSLGMGGVMSLGLSRAVLTKVDVVVGFFGFLLWLAVTSL